MECCYQISNELFGFDIFARSYGFEINLKASLDYISRNGNRRSLILDLNMV